MWSRDEVTSCFYFVIDTTQESLALSGVLSAPEEAPAPPRMVLELYEDWCRRADLTYIQFAQLTGLHPKWHTDRRYKKTVPSFSELLSAARQLSFVEWEPCGSTAVFLWSHPIVREAREAWLNDVLSVSKRSKVVALLHTILSCTGVAPTVQSLREKLAFTASEARSVASFLSIPWGSVARHRNVLQHIIGAEDFAALRGLWQEEQRAQHEQRTFTTVFKRICKERGITYKQLADALRIDTGNPEHQPHQVVGALVRTPTQSVGYGYGVSRAVLSHLVSRTDEECHNLRGLAIAARREHRERRGKRVLSPLRDEREWFGITPEEIESTTGYTAKELLEIERGDLCVSAKEQEQLIAIVRREGERRVKQAQGYWKQYREPSGMYATVAMCIQNAGGYQPFEHVIKEGSPQRIARKFLTQIVSCQAVPSFPLLRHMVERGGGRMTAALEEDWSFEYALRLSGNGDSFLFRVIDSIRAERYCSWREYEKKHGRALKNILPVLRRGQCVEKNYILRFLSAMCIEPLSPRFIFVNSLLEKQDIPIVLHEWYQSMQKRCLPVDMSFRSLPGLTREESPKPMFDAVMGKVKERYPCLSQEDERQVADCIIPMAIDGILTEEALERIERNYGSHLRTQKQLALRRERLFAWVRMRDPSLVDAARAVFEHAVNDVLAEEVPEPVARKKLDKILAVQHLVQQAVKIDATVVGRARAVFEEAAEELIEHQENVSTCERVLQQAVLIERTMQLAYLTYRGPVSEYYAVLKIFVTQLVEEGRGEDEVHSLLKKKISSLVARVPM